MRTRTLILIVLKAALVAFVVAQSSAAKTTPDVAATGSVTGHVFLPESNLPARFASVALQKLCRIENIAPAGIALEMPMRIVPNSS